MFHKKHQGNELVEFIQFRCAQLGGHHWVERRGNMLCDLCQRVQNEHDELYEMEQGFAEELKF